MRRWLEDELPFGKLMDFGMVEYREFACSRATYEWLAGGAMTSVDGVPVKLWVADSYGANVIVQARPENWVRKESAAYAWQKAA